MCRFTWLTFRPAGQPKTGTSDGPFGSGSAAHVCHGPPGMNKRCVFACRRGVILAGETGSDRGPGRSCYRGRLGRELTSEITQRCGARSAKDSRPARDFDRQDNDNLRNRTRRRHAAHSSAYSHAGGAFKNSRKAAVSHSSVSPEITNQPVAPVTSRNAAASRSSGREPLSLPSSSSY